MFSPRNSPSCNNVGSFSRLGQGHVRTDRILDMWYNFVKGKPLEIGPYKTEKKHAKNIQTFQAKVCEVCGNGLTTAKVQKIKQFYHLIIPSKGKGLKKCSNKSSSKR